MIHWQKKPTISFPHESPYHSLVCTKPGRVVLGKTSNAIPINFPKGWRTDLTSTPRSLYWLVPQVGTHNPAVILHDRLLDLGYDRKIARYWMVQQLRLLTDVSKTRRALIHAGVYARDIQLAILKKR